MDRTHGDKAVDHSPGSHFLGVLRAISQKENFLEERIEEFFHMDHMGVGRRAQEGNPWGNYPPVSVAIYSPFSINALSMLPRYIFLILHMGRMVARL